MSPVRRFSEPYTFMLVAGDVAGKVGRPTRDQYSACLESEQDVSQII